MQDIAPTTVSDAGVDERRPKTAVAVKGLVRGFDGRTVLDGLDLYVQPGEAVAIIGANGSGKSTCLRCILRLVEPERGTIDVLGERITSLRGGELKRLRSSVGFVFQRHNLVPRLSALTNVLHGVQSRSRGPRTWLQSLATAEARAEAMACLDAVGLADQARQRADSLSGGQSQRVAIARMLMQRPQLILADEPDASLDPRTGEEIMALLHGLARAKGLAIIVVSHRLEHARAHADRIVGIAAGRVSLDVTTQSVGAGQLRGFFDEAAA